MYDAGDTEDGEFRKRSAWIFPLGIVSVVFLLSVAVMLFYFSPTTPDLFHEQVSPTSDGERVNLSVDGQKFSIPANYLRYESTRKGGAAREISMHAKLPGLQGWSNWQADAFADASAESTIIFLTLHTDRNKLNEADRLRRVYGDYVDTTAHPAPYGLIRFDYRPNAGYGDEDFFVGNTDNGPIVLRCARQSLDAPSPNCLREQYLTGGVSLSWRFKRTQLPHWRQIEKNVAELMATFRTPPK